MSATVTVGKRLIPIEHIALIEPFDPAAHPRMQTERPFQARIVLIDRESVLTEEAPAAFSEAHGFRMLADERVATNPAIRFGVETFEPAEGFKPTKPYLARLLWRDLDGNTQSKLLLSKPETVLAIAVKGEIEMPLDDAAHARVSQPTGADSSRRRSRRRAPSIQPV